MLVNGLFDLGELSVFLCPLCRGPSEGFNLHRFTNGDAQNANDGGEFSPTIKLPTATTSRMRG
jgi:hypothetical protein